VTDHAPRAPDDEGRVEPALVDTRVWPVFAAWIMAFVAIIILSALAAVLLSSMYPDVSPAVLLRQLPGLLAGAMASSTALIVTLLLVNRTIDPVRLRLSPGREKGRDLAVMIVGMLALGQALDSLTTLAGLGQRGAFWDARQMLAGAAGGELFMAVLVVGLLAGSAEELFFRAFMQTRLRARWPPVGAVLATSACFGLMHIEWLHALLAFVLALYLGFITELSGSALPAVAAHVVNNVLFTLLTALGGTVATVGPNLALLVAGIVVCASCVLVLRRRLPPAGLR
jgi:membrane protease YdiL (CAAX protease family)